ncbi:MAG: S24/S26 family peptidase [Pseudomonadota bacterium]
MSSPRCSGKPRASKPSAPSARTSPRWKPFTRYFSPGAWQRQRMRLFRVNGRSMLPTLREGDFVIGRRFDAGRSRLNTGQIVCVQHAHFGWMIKRIGALAEDQVRLDSDGQTGSETIGWVDAHRVRYAAVLAIGKRGIRRLHQVTSNNGRTS